ncbi:MAG: hypothetical protein M3Q88_03455 [Pseudomonadota bacterium]|nr:hypothetical protein [Pseudomonadota bacterium]
MTNDNQAQQQPPREGKQQSPEAKQQPREATQQGAPERELELKLKKDPNDPSAKVDVGSDESMDASDPVSATIPGTSEPAPSSGFPDDE